MDHQQLIEKFYRSFKQRDWRGMQSCYHEEVMFSDPVFRDLKGKRARAMWHMLVEAGKDLVVTFNSVTADGHQGSCHWEAIYSFSRTGRKVHNIIDARFAFKDGKIVQHVDSFDLWRWSSMALGTSGKLLGWTPLVQRKIRSTAEASLSKFIGEHPEYS